MDKVLLVVSDELRDKYFNMLTMEYEVLFSSDIDDALLICAKIKVDLVVYELDLEKDSCISFLDLIWSVPQIPKVVGVAKEITSEEEIQVMNKSVIECYMTTEDDRLVATRIRKISKRNLKYLYGRKVESKREEIVLDCDLRTCYKKGKLVHLSSIEFAILNAFLSAKNYCFSEDFIYALVFGKILYNSDLRQVNNVIYKLRRKLGISSITSLNSTGYVWKEI